jgi:hypothetical protein
MKVIRVALIVAAVAFVGGCKDKSAATTENSTVAADSIKPKDAASTTGEGNAASADSITLVSRAREILKLAASKDYAQIAPYIHPTFGIRFSPYTYVHVDEDLHFTVDSFREHANKDAKKKVLWGTYDPMGEPIKLTLEGYFKEFGYDHDYLKEGRFAFNQTIGGGTTINNIQEIYPSAVFVEAYWAPDDEEKANYEWGSLRLVFESHEGKWFLVGWVHDAWST